MAGSVVENQLTISDDQIYHIYKHEGFTFCLVCKYEIVEGGRDYLILNHLCCLEHQDNMKSLFKSCVPDPLCDSVDERYGDFVTNSVLDISLLLGEERSYICDRGDDVFCLICKEAICKVTVDSEMLSFKLINHLQSALHLNTIKDTVCWVYRLNRDIDFIMFHKSVVYCSVCKETLECELNSLLQTAVSHLQTVQHEQQSLTEKTVSEIIVNEEVDSDDDEMSRRFASLGIFKDRSDVDSNITYTDNDSCMSDDIMEEFYDCNEYNVLCPDCGEFIEMFNENASFSMQLHSQKHKDLSSINSNLGFEFQEDTDYVCPVCQETILILNRNVELSINRHFENHQHERDGCGYTEYDDFHLLNNVFANLPETFNVYRNFFVMDGNEFFCKLCNCTVSSSKDLSVACNILRDHMLQLYHEEQYNESVHNLTAVVVNYNKENLDQRTEYEENSVFESLLKRCTMIRNNKHLIEKRKINYFCTMCQKHICNSPNEATLKLNFVLHFKGHAHNKALKQQRIEKNEKRKEERKEEVKKVIKQLTKSVAAVSLNHHYIKERSGNFFCEVCQKSIQFTTKGFSLVSHCSSSAHNNELTEKANDFIENLENKPRISGKRFQKFDAVLKKIAKNPVMSSHVKFITSSKRRFICLLCNIPISFSEDGQMVLHHFFGSTHKENAYEVNFNGDVDSLIKESHTNTKDQTVNFPPLRDEKDVTSSASSSVVSQKGISPTCSNAEMKKQRKRAWMILQMLKMNCNIVRKNQTNIQTRNGQFFCKLCEETMICTRRGIQLICHLASETHAMNSESK